MCKREHILASADSAPGHEPFATVTGQSPRVAIVGAGLMGTCHAKEIVRAGATLAAIVDPDPDAARQLASGRGNALKQSGATVYQSLPEALEKESLGVVHICSPLASHVFLATAALEAGCHVVIEKPVAPTAGETMILLEVAERAGRMICPVHQFMFQDGVRKAAGYLPEIGRIVHAEMVVNSAGADAHSEGMRNEVVSDILPHPLSLLELLIPYDLDEIVWAGSHGEPGELRINGNVADVSLAINVSMSSRPTCCDFTIFGTGGTVKMNLFHGYATVRRGQSRRADKIVNPFRHNFSELTGAAANMARRIIRWEPAYPGLRTLIREFYEAVEKKGRSPVPPSHILGAAVQRDKIIEIAGLEQD